MKTFFSLFIICLWVACVVGWIMNIVQIVSLLHAPVTGIFVFKVVGIICFPLGAILGFIG